MVSIPFNRKDWRKGIRSRANWLLVTGLAVEMRLRSIWNLGLESLNPHSNTVRQPRLLEWAVVVIATRTWAIQILIGESNPSCQEPGIVQALKNLKKIRGGWRSQRIWVDSSRVSRTMTMKSKVGPSCERPSWAWIPAQHHPVSVSVVTTSLVTTTSLKWTVQRKFTKSSSLEVSSKSVPSLPFFIGVKEIRF